MRMSRAGFGKMLPAPRASSAVNFVFRVASVLAAILFACFLNFSFTGTALASGISHAHAAAHGSDKAAAVVHAPEARQEAVASALSVKFMPNGIDCPGHDRRGSNEKSSQCCGVACCATALAGVTEIGLAPIGQSTSHTLPLVQFVRTGLVFDLNRPPDFHA